MKSEFEEIPQISARTSELPDGCETKNRYANVIPLPETRVFLKPLQGSPNSDYINANYVTVGFLITEFKKLTNEIEALWYFKKNIYINIGTKFKYFTKKWYPKFFYTR